MGIVWRNRRTTDCPKCGGWLGWEGAEAGAYCEKCGWESVSGYRASGSSGNELPPIPHFLRRHLGAIVWLAIIGALIAYSAIA